LGVSTEGSEEKEEWTRTLRTDLDQSRNYMKEVKLLIEQADVILEILDARDPLGCRCVDIEKYILSQMTPSGTPSKRLILVLNKIDLIPGDNLMAWMKYLRREFPTVAFKSSIQQKGMLTEFALKPSLAIHTKQDVTAFSGTIGGNALLQLLKNYSRSHNMKTALTVGVIGYPNVGKSSIINSLKRQRAVTVGSTPGITKALQHVKLDKQISLIDSPGVLFSVGKEDEDLVLRNCLKAEKIINPVGVVERIVKKCEAELLRETFDIEPFTNADEFLRLVAIKRGKIKKGGVPQIEKAALVVILDWNAGKIPFHSDPPIVQDIQTSEIIRTWNQEFDIENVDDEKAATMDTNDTEFELGDTKEVQEQKK